MKKIFNAVKWLVGILLMLIVILVFLIVRPMGEETEKDSVIAPEEIHNVMGAAGKLSSAMFRGMREPEKSFTVTLNPGETSALLASLCRLGDPYLGNDLTLRSLTTEENRIVCGIEIPLKKIAMIPIVTKVRGKIADGRIYIEFDSIKAGALPLPTCVAQHIVDQELAKFRTTKEGKILKDFVSRMELSDRSALTIEATAQGFKILHKRLVESRF